MESIAHIGRWLKCFSRLPGNTDVPSSMATNMGFCVFCVGSYRIILRGNVSQRKAVGKMSFLSHWWDMLVPRRGR